MSHILSSSQADGSSKPQVERPSAALLTYYLLVAIATLPGFIIAFPLLWIRFKTLRYELQDSGIRMSVGIVFRREVIVAYRRIQDIHVSHNIIQRWLGIANVSIQTASGNSMPEIVVEGVTNPNQLRDWLYERTRGAKNPSSPKGNAEAIATNSIVPNDEATVLLQGIRDHLAELVRQGRRSSSQEKGL